MASNCGNCTFKDSLPESAGILWVKERAYPFASDFAREAYALSVSIRTPTWPNDFVLGQTWVFLAHTKSVCKQQPDLGFPVYLPGVFYAFLPTSAEYVVKGGESRAMLEKFRARGITPVRLKPRQAVLFPELVAA